MARRSFLTAPCLSRWRDDDPHQRIYEEPSPRDGLRILVERLWPRGLNEKRAAVDLWLKDIAPSAELRKWFGHDPARWVQFQKRYRQELRKRKTPFGR
jgi:uncharacterized protein YeaO (DUF488 family)